MQSNADVLHGVRTNADCWVTFVRETLVNSDPVLPFLVDANLTWHSALIISSNGRAIAIVGEYDKKSVEDIGAYDEVIGYVRGIKSHFANTMRSLNPSSIAINFSEGSEICDGLSYGMYLTLHSYLAEIGYANHLLSAEKIISALRQRKTVSNSVICGKPSEPRNRSSAQLAISSASGKMW